MADAVKDDPVKRVTEAKVLEALGKFKPGVSDLERIYMASGIDPIYGPDVDYNLDYQLLAGQPYANYLTTTGTPVGGGTGGGTGGGGIPTLPPFTYPSTPDAEDFELDVVNIPESTETWRNTDVGSTRDQDFFSPQNLYGEYADDFDFSKFDGDPIDWENTRLAKRLRKEAKEFGGRDFLGEGIKGLLTVDPRKIPGISALMKMGERGIAALKNLLPRYREDVDAYGQTFKGDMVSAEGLGLYPEVDESSDSSLGLMGESFTDVDAFRDVSDPSNILKRLNKRMEEQGIETQARINALERVKEKIAKERANEKFTRELAVLNEAREAREAGKGKPRYGHVDAPGSAWSVTTPHIDSYIQTTRTMPGGQKKTVFRPSAANLGAKGFGGIRGRMLPKASGSWEGDNPFGKDYQPPSPGDPRYADYVAASMGPSPNMQREIEQSVSRHVPFVKMDDGQGNSYLVNKQTQEIMAGPFPSGDESIGSIPSIGSMAEGGLAAFAKGDLVQNFPRKNGKISGPGTERSDDIPAMLSDGEFVTNAAALRGRLGAREMYKLQRQGMKAAGVV